jgi:hypothetical protein
VSWTGNAVLIHFWPFDGWAVPEDRSVIAEVCPSIFRNRYAPNLEKGLWAIMNGVELHGMIFFHCGDESGFVAKKGPSGKKTKQ